MSNTWYEFLNNMSIFAGLSADEFQRVLDHMEEKIYPAGVEIIEENSQAEAFYIILEGSVEVTKQVEMNKYITLAILSGGDFFGEMAAIEEGVRSATVRTLESTRVLKIDHKDFFALIQSIPMLTYGLLKELSARLRKSDDRIAGDSIPKKAMLRQVYMDTVTGVANTIEARDPYTGGHTERVSALAVRIAMQLGMTDKDELAALSAGALLHDIGKISVSDTILSKPDSLSESEVELIKDHIHFGTHMLSDVYFLERSMPIVAHHHERYDGRGYPDHLSGEDIPLGARILAVVDAFDAMTTDRPYRLRLSIVEALHELESGSGTQFDPQIVSVFLQTWKKS